MDSSSKPSRIVPGQATPHFRCLSPCAGRSRCVQRVNAKLPLDAECFSQMRRSPTFQGRSRCRRRRGAVRGAQARVAAGRAFLIARALRAFGVVVPDSRKSGRCARAARHQRGRRYRVSGAWGGGVGGDRAPQFQLDPASVAQSAGCLDADPGAWRSIGDPRTSVDNASLPASQCRGSGVAVHVRRSFGMTQRFSAHSMPTRAPKKRQGGASCCISTQRVAPVLQIPMKPPRLSSVTESAPQARGQLSLAIESPAIAAALKPTSGRPLITRHPKRVIALDEILWMRDVVHLTGKHRCTIHRWIQQGLFPPKNAPRGRPTGWLKSTVERWLLGSSQP